MKTQMIHNIKISEMELLIHYRKQLRLTNQTLKQRLELNIHQILEVDEQIKQLESEKNGK
jgi:hypothetical protein